MQQRIKQDISLVFLVFLLSCVTLHAGGRNIIKNGSFESSSPTGKLTDWEQWPTRLGPGASIQQDSAIARNVLLNNKLTSVRD